MKLFPLASKKFQLITILIWLSVLCSFGQRYETGYIINLDGDKIDGLIEKDKTLNQFFGCNFKLTETSPPIPYSHEEIMAYGFNNGDKFITHQIIFDNASEKVFLKILEEGNINLYSFLERYFIEKSEKLIEFNLTLGRGPFNNSLFSKLMNDCDRSNKRLTGLYENNINFVKNLVKSYNQCSDKDIDTFTLEIRPLIGIENSRLILTSSMGVINEIANKRIRNHNLITGGVNFLLYYKNVKQALSFGLFYAERSYFLNLTSTKLKRIDEVRFSHKSLLIPIQIHLNLKENKKTIPFIRAGIRLPITSMARNYWIIEEDFGNEVIITNVNLFSNYKEPVQFTFNAGMDIRLNERVSAVLEFSLFTGKRESNLISFPVKLNLSGLNINTGLKF